MANKKAKGKAKGKQNSYVSNARKKNILNNMTQKLPTKGNAQNTAIETVKDIVLCVLGGGLLGAAIGKPSLVIGLGVTGAGHYTGNRAATMLGLGIMAANGFQNNKSVNGMDGFDVASVKNRIMTYKNNFAGKLYLDKIMPGKTPANEDTNGFGELQFFSYPNDVNGAGDELSGELSALDRIERQLEESGMEHMQVTGLDDIGEVGKLSDDMGIVTVADLNL
jgi:hypothetical protein